MNSANTGGLLRWDMEHILTVPTETIIDIPVDMTIVDGKIAYQREA